MNRIFTWYNILLRAQIDQFGLKVNSWKCNILKIYNLNDNIKTEL